MSLWDKRRNCEWKAEWMMFADDTALVGDGEEKLQRLVKESGDAWTRRKLTVNVSTSKTVKMRTFLDDARCEVANS